MDFEAIYNIVVETNGSEAAFSRGECEALAKFMHELPPGASIVEIGVQFGRSTTVLGCIAKEKGFNVTLVDNWLEDVSTPARKNIEAQIEKYKWPVAKLWMDSNFASKLYEGKIDLIHIDGDHNYEGVLSDCEHWLSKVNRGGYVLFDDYGHDSLPGVWKACKEYFAEHKNWEFIGRFADKLGVYKKI